MVVVVVVPPPWLARVTHYEIGSSGINDRVNIHALKSSRHTMYCAHLQQMENFITITNYWYLLYKILSSNHLNPELWREKKDMLVTTIKVIAVLVVDVLTIITPRPSPAPADTDGDNLQYYIPTVFFFKSVKKITFYS